MKPIISVIIADDHAFFRAGINAVLDKQAHIQVVGEASNGREVIELVARHAPDVVLMDIKMPVMTGLEATKILAEKYPSTGIIALSMVEGNYVIQEMIHYGARGFLQKNVMKQELLDAIENVHNNRPYYCTGTRLRMAEGLETFLPGDAAGIIDTLTTSEKEVLLLICRQHSTKAMSQILNRGVRTIEKDRERLLEKTGRQNTAGLVVFAVIHHLYIPTPEDLG